MSAPRIFLSYSHEDKQLAAQVAEDLLARGFALWQDIEDIRLGRRIESEMEAGIAGCDAVLHLFTPASLQSSAVRREVSLALTRRRNQPGFPVVALSQDLGDDHEQVGRRLHRELGENFAREWLTILPVGPVADQETATFARFMLKTFFPRGRGPDDGQWRIGLHARARCPGSHDLDLDWRPLVGGERRQPGNAVVWARLWRAVRDVRDVLSEHGGRRKVVLTASAHHTAGLVTGLAFSRNAHFDLEVEQDGETWRRGRDQQVPGGFSINSEYGDLEATLLSCEMSVARDLNGAVTGHLADTATEPRARVRVAPQGEIRNLTASEGADLARAAASHLKRGADQLACNSVQFYLATPLPLTVLLGTELGALHTEIRLLEYDRRAYHLSHTVPEDQR